VDENSPRDRPNLLEGVHGPNLEEQKQLVQAVVARIEVDLWRPTSPADRTRKSRLLTRGLLVNISLKSASVPTRPGEFSCDQTHSRAAQWHPLRRSS